jgi:hypothetical protein
VAEAVGVPVLGMVSVGQAPVRRAVERALEAHGLPSTISPSSYRPPLPSTGPPRYAASAAICYKRVE